MRTQNASYARRRQRAWILKREGRARPALSSRRLSNIIYLEENPSPVTPQMRPLHVVAWKLNRLQASTLNGPWKYMRKFVCVCVCALGVILCCLSVPFITWRWEKPPFKFFWFFFWRAQDHCDMSRMHRESCGAQEIRHHYSTRPAEEYAKYQGDEREDRLTILVHGLKNR